MYSNVIDFSKVNNSNIHEDNELKKMFLNFSSVIIDCCLMLRVMDKCALLVYLRDRLEINDLKCNRSSDIKSVYRKVLNGFAVIISNSDFNLLRLGRFKEILDVKPLFELMYKQLTILFGNVFINGSDVMRVVIKNFAESDVVKRFGFFDYRILSSWRDIFDRYIRGINSGLYKVSINKFEFFYSQFELERLTCGEFIRDMPSPFNISTVMSLFNLTGKNMKEYLPYSMDSVKLIHSYNNNEFKLWLLDYLNENVNFILNDAVK